MENKNHKKNKTSMKFPSTSKILLFSVVLMCFEIVFFCEYAMLKLCDTSAMYALIGIPAALAPVALGYLQKAKAENSQGGITYDLAMAQLNTETENLTDEESPLNNDSEAVG